MSLFDRRRAGILLHPTSLPGAIGNGDFGADAYRFIDFLESAGQRVWQMLPLGPTHGNRSPYQCLSIYAGDYRLINLESLLRDGWLTGEDMAIFAEHGAASDDAAVAQCRRTLLARASHRFEASADAAQQALFKQFRERQAHWLEDYALFQALREAHEGRDWTAWPVSYKDRRPKALAKFGREQGQRIHELVFEQFVFFQQWQALRQYANQRQILLFGDMPIFVAHDSVDVWVNRDLFDLNKEGQPESVAGVPPDYFSETGQRWGNPLYRWQRMAADGYRWWSDRIAWHFELFDIVRIDHFRAFEAYWRIPATEAVAINGEWIEGPGEGFFDRLQAHLGDLALVAEDLGFITPAVHRLREKYRFPGMRILQFAFDGNRDNPYLPHNHQSNSIVYTGTHDNDTTLGWFRKLGEEQQELVKEYFGVSGESPCWALIRGALASVAHTVVVPLQDVMELDSEHRMNIPGTDANNWRWRFDWWQLPTEAAPRLRRLTELYGRL